jgi:hypothetical protein
VVDTQQFFEAIRKSEAKLLDSYEQDVDLELHLADHACALLLAVLLGVEGRDVTFTEDDVGELTGDITALQLYAQLLVGVRVFRTVHAGRAVLASGYEPEVPALDRILVELQAHRRAMSTTRRERKPSPGSGASEAVVSASASASTRHQISTATSRPILMAIRCQPCVCREGVRESSWHPHEGSLPVLRFFCMPEWHETRRLVLRSWPGLRSRVCLSSMPRFRRLRLSSVRTMSASSSRPSRRPMSPPAKPDPRSSGRGA